MKLNLEKRDFEAVNRFFKNLQENGVVSAYGKANFRITFDHINNRVVIDDINKA